MAFSALIPSIPQEINSRVRPQKHLPIQGYLSPKTRLPWGEIENKLTCQSNKSMRKKGIKQPYLVQIFLAVLCLSLLLCLTPLLLAHPQASNSNLHLSFSGLSLGCFSLNQSSVKNLQTVIRFLPEILCNKSLSSTWQLDLDFSIDGQGSLRSSEERKSSFSARARLYRAWLRLSQPRFEARLGLQKINFGSAALFRPLMWFDQLDPS